MVLANTHWVGTRCTAHWYTPLWSKLTKFRESYIYISSLFNYKWRSFKVINNKDFCMYCLTPSLLTLTNSFSPGHILEDSLLWKKLMALSLVYSGKIFALLLSTLGSSPFSFFNTCLFLAILLDTWKNSSISLRVQLSETKDRSFAFSSVFADMTFSFIKDSLSKSSAFLQQTTFCFCESSSMF